MLHVGLMVRLLCRMGTEVLACCLVGVNELLRDGLGWSVAALCFGTMRNSLHQPVLSA